MSPLRQKMIDTMVLMGRSPRTQETYLYAVTQLAACNRSFQGVIF